MSNDLKVIATVIQEILAAHGMVGGSALGHALNSYLKGRGETARDILLKRLKEGEIDLIDAANEDEFIAVISSYILSAQQNAAQVNLDLLAQAIVGELKGGSLNPDNFQKYKNILSSLTRDEILVIGTYHRCFTTISEEQKKNYVSFWGEHKPTHWQKFLGELVPSCLPTYEHVEVVLGSLIRTGLTVANPPQLGQNPSHRFTILLDEILKLVNFEEAYKRYPEY
jgi:hypothetical protein